MHQILTVSFCLFLTLTGCKVASDIYTPVTQSPYLYYSLTVNSADTSSGSISLNDSSGESCQAKVMQTKTAIIKAVPASGYSFYQWQISSGSGAIVAKPSSSSTTITMGSSDVVLTAVFQRGLKITYEDNGATSGSVPVDSTLYTLNSTATVLGNTGGLSITGYIFSGWNTSAAGDGTGFVAGNELTMTENETLYAIYSSTTLTQPVQLTVTMAESPSTTYLARGQTLNVTTGVTLNSGTADSYTYTCYLDGASVDSVIQAGLTWTYSLDLSTLKMGNHTLNVIVTTGGLSFSPASSFSFYLMD